MFINTLIKEHITPESKYFWTGLQNVNDTGEFQWITKDGRHKDMTYSNWNAFEPGTQCVRKSVGYYFLVTGDTVAH